MMTKDEQHADDFTELVLKRTGLTRGELKCPREKSDMTPCLARDGHLVVVYSHGEPICVGCEAKLNELLAKERVRN